MVQVLKVVVQCTSNVYNEDKTEIIPRLEILKAARLVILPSTPSPVYILPRLHTT